MDSPVANSFPHTGQITGNPRFFNLRAITSLDGTIFWSAVVYSQILYTISAICCWSSSFPSRRLGLHIEKRTLAATIIALAASLSYELFHAIVCQIERKQCHYLTETIALDI